MKIKLTELVTSPFRNFKLSPLSEEKVAALIESINQTGYWNNIRVREVNGQFEIIAGHHRREALQRMGHTEAEVIVVKLSDAEVLQLISRDHDDTYEHDLGGLIELVRATVNLHAEGKIPAEMMPVAKDTPKAHIRIAPSFVPPSAPSAEGPQFTVMSIAKFLGYTRSKGTDPKKTVIAAMKFLELMERRLFTEKDIQSFTRPDGAIVAEQILKVCATEEKKAEVNSDTARRKALADAKATERQAELNQQALIAERQREQKAEQLLKELQEKQREDLTPKQEEKVKEQIKEAKAEVKDAGRQVARTKKAIEKRKKIEAEQKRKDDDQRARRAEEERVRWVNDVVTQGNKTFDRFCMIRNNFLDLSKADHKHSQITASEKKKLLASLEGICDRVRETIAALKDAPVIGPERSAR